MTKTKPLKVIVGISGGVDSAVSALLLKQAGYEVKGIFMQNWDSFINHEWNHVSDQCDSQVEYQDAQLIAQKLGIELIKVNFIKEYWTYVFQAFLDQYQAGLTPNPDVLCNKYIKFGFLIDYCQKNLDFDYIATGHYAKVVHENKQSILMMPKDLGKDQTYFLCELTQLQLKKALFPLSELTKYEVRQIAQQNDLFVWNKKDSTGICFIGKRNFKDFLQNYLPPKKGDIIDIITNQVVGNHDGAYFYTLGQNDGLGLSGAKTKYYVVKKDITNNLVYVSDKQHKDHYLTSFSCEVEQFNFITRPKQINNLMVRFRHLQKLTNCKIEILNENKIKIIYINGSSAVTCGQYAVIYEQDVCIGGGQITKVNNYEEDLK